MEEEASDTKIKTRVKKVTLKNRNMDEESKHHLILTKLNILEEDDDVHKDE